MSDTNRSNANRFMRERTARAYSGMHLLNAAATSSLNVMNASQKVQNFFQSRYTNQNRKSSASLAAMRRNSNSRRFDEQKPLYPAFMLQAPATLLNLKLSVENK